MGISIRVAVTAAVVGAALAASADQAERPALAGSSAKAGRQAPNNRFRASLISQCVRVRKPAATLALALDGAPLPFELATGHEPGSRPRCRDDELRLLRLQSLRIDGRRTYVRRGGCQLRCVKPQATVHVAASALRGRVRLLSRRARNGNGAPVSGCTRPVRNAPERVGALLRRMYYKTPAELRRRRNAGRSGGDGARWSNYGDPGARYRSGDRPAAHYNYLLWNMPRDRRGILPGGGIIAAILRAGQPLRLCAGQRLSLPAFDVVGRRNGHVSFGYARVHVGGRRGYSLHGWVLLGYRYLERAYTATVVASRRPVARRPRQVGRSCKKPILSNRCWAFRPP